MDKDFYYAIIAGWSILFLFWLFTLLFIYLRKPPKSKLSLKLFIKSIIVFIVILSTIYFFKVIDSF